MVTYLSSHIFKIGAKVVGVLKGAMHLFIWLCIVVSCHSFIYDVVEKV